MLENFGGRPTAVHNYHPSHYVTAQSPVAWLDNSCSLEQQATTLWLSAVEQMPRYDKAVDKAMRQAERLFTANPALEIVTVPVSAPEPRFLPCFLLYGYAIESALKGLFVKNHPDAIHPEKAGVPKSHNQPRLAQLAGYEPISGEADLMQKLSTVVIWSGRYPVPKTREEHARIGPMPQAVFQDPVAVGHDAQQLAKKLQALIDPTFPRNAGPAIVVRR